MSDQNSALVAALSALPAFRGASWRAAGFEVVAPFTVETPIPTSRSVRVATENFAADGAHVFLSVSARDVGMVSAQPAEQEIALLPGARYVPATAFHDVAGLRVQVIVEQPSDGGAVPELPTGDELEGLLESERRSAFVATLRPGRFGRS